MSNSGGIGGKARRVEMTMQELEDRLLEAERIAYAMGFDAGQKVVQLPVNDCPMCKLQAEYERLRDSHRALESKRAAGGRRW